MLSEGAAFVLTLVGTIMNKFKPLWTIQIVHLNVGEVGIHSYTAAESDGPQSFKQVSACPEKSLKFYKLSDYTGA